MVNNKKPTIVKVPNTIDKGLLFGLLILEVSRNGTMKRNMTIAI